jgi:hypothetical protein
MAGNKMKGVESKTWSCLLSKNLSSAAFLLMGVFFKERQRILPTPFPLSQT